MPLTANIIVSWPPLLRASHHSWSHEPAAWHTPFPSLGTEQSQNPPPPPPKAVALPYCQQKEESITQGRVPCKLWPRGSPRCCRNVLVAALLTPVRVTSLCGLRWPKGQVPGPCTPPRPKLLLAPHWHLTGKHTRISRLTVEIWCCLPGPSTLAYLRAFALGAGSAHRCFASEMLETGDHTWYLVVYLLHTVAAALLSLGKRLSQAAQY